MIAEILGPSGKVHYRRPVGDPMIAEAERTPGYSVRIVPASVEFHDLCRTDPALYNQFN